MTAKEDLATLVGTLTGDTSDQITALTALVTAIVAFEAADPAVPNTLAAVDTLLTEVADLDATVGPITALTTMAGAYVTAEVEPDTDLIGAWNAQLAAIADWTAAVGTLGLYQPSASTAATAAAYGLDDPGGDYSYWIALESPLNTMMQVAQGMATDFADQYNTDQWHAMYSVLAQLLGVVTAYMNQVDNPAAPVDVAYATKLIDDLYRTLNGYVVQSTLVPELALPE